MNYQILLYYKYAHVEDPKLEMERQRAFCQALNITGRIIIAEEGINGTIEGTVEATEKYIIWMKENKKFRDIHWKKSTGTGDAFPRLSVKVRKEIVSLHLYDAGDDINPNELTGIHLRPKELRRWYEEGKEFYIVDMRNDYELEVGKFENTVFPGLSNFRDLQEKLNTIENLKDKTVLTVCTGGVRCEKASGFLKREGFKNVYQLDGGMVTYMEKYPGMDFKGSLYVFDKRKVVHFESPEKHEIIGRCRLCQQPSETYVNCADPLCHDHFICCTDCGEDRSVLCNKHTKTNINA